MDWLLVEPAAVLEGLALSTEILGLAGVVLGENVCLVPTGSAVEMYRGTCPELAVVDLLGLVGPSSGC